jgi:ribosome maturation factor RimP
MDEEKLKIIENDVNEALKTMNIMVSDISYEVSGNYNFLRIELDKVNGLDLDTIVEATNIINPLVDKYKFLKDSYILDVISKEKGDE